MTKYLKNKWNRVSKIFATIATLFLLMGLSQSAFTLGTLIKAPERVDMTYDQTRNILYITSGDSVLRYDLSTNTFLSPFKLSGSLRGIDISADSNTLAVADFSIFGIHLVDLKTGKAKIVNYEADGEWGSYTVAFGKDNSLLISSYPGPLRKYNLSTNSFSSMTSPMKALLSPSADRSMIAYVQSDVSSGPFGRYDLAKNKLDQKSGYEEGTDSFNFDLAVNHNGSEYAILSAGGAVLTDGFLTKFAIIGDWSGQPAAAAYNPIKDILYLPWAGTSQIYVYNTNTLQKIAAYDVESLFQLDLLRDYPMPHMDCRIKISPDGKSLFVTVADGIKYIDLTNANANNQLIAHDSSVHLKGY